MPGWQSARSLARTFQRSCSRKADSLIQAQRQETPTEYYRRFAPRDYANLESSLAMLSRMKDVGGASLVTRTNLRGSNLSGRDNRGGCQGHGDFHALVRSRQVRVAQGHGQGVGGVRRFRDFSQAQ